MINKYYFVSKKRLTNVIIKPRVPKNRLTESGREDNKTERICVSKSIFGCLYSTAIYQNRKRIYLYYCEVDNKNVIQPTEKQVNDGKYTGEEWIICPVTMKLETILHITSEKITNDYIKYIIKDKDTIGFYRMEIVEHI